MPINRGMMTSTTSEWATPQEFFDELNREFHFTLDPCCTPLNRKCDRYFTKEDNGLLQSWQGEIVFCNPPYGRKIGEWVKKCYQEAANGATCVMLIPARTDTSYFHDYIYGKHEIRFIRGRLRFGGCDQNAPFPSMVVVMRGGVVMFIGLWNDSTRFPNLCTMKISAFCKATGDHTELYDPSHEYDLIFASKVFTESKEPDFGNVPVIRGGSGYDLHNKLPDHIEHIYPDYSLYPEFTAALGVLTRGCPRLNHAQSHGGFCITPDKDGCKSRKVADLSEFWNGQESIYLLDQNLLAAPERKELLQQLIDSKAIVTFDGGMDVRYMNDEIIEMFRQMRVKDYHFAWDDPTENLESKFERVAQSGLLRKDRCGVYVLTNFWSTTEQDLHRIYTLRKYGYVPYVMVYDKQKFVHDNGKWRKGVETLFTPEQLRQFKACQHLQRWCNNRALIQTIPDFNDYEPYAKWVQSGKPIPSKGGVGD